MATADGHLLFDTKLDADGLKKGLDALGGVASTAMKGVTVAVGAVGTALSAMGGYAIKVGSDFEAAMSQVKAISGANAKEFDALKEKAKEMGATTKFSATESAEALNYMAMAGWKTQQMLDGLPGIMNLAAASGEELGTVSDIVTDALTAFGLKAEESGRFADVLAQASASSNTNVSMMGATFKYVAPVAGALGYSVEDVAVAVGLMANASIKGEQAGTSLRGALTRLVKPTKEVNAALENLGMVSKTYGNVINEKDVAKAEKQITSASKSITSAQESVEKKTISVQKAQAAYNQALEKYGADSTQAQQKALSLQNAQNNLASAQDKLSAAQGKLTDSQNALSSAQSGNMEVTSSSVNLLTDQAGNMRPLIDVIKDLREAFKGLSQEEQAQTAASLFGQEAMSGMLAIINASDEDFQKLSKSISESEGATDRFATIMQDNLKGQLDNLSSAVEGLGIEFYESIDNPLKEVAKNATGYVNQMSKAFKKGGISGLVSEIGEVFSGVAVQVAKSAPEMVKSAVKVLTSFAKGLWDNRKSLIDSATKLVKTIADTFTDLLPSELQAPVRKMISDLSRSFSDEGLKKAISTVGNIIKSIGDVIISVAQSAIPLVVTAIDLFGEHLDVIISLLGAAAAGMIAYNAAVKAGLIIETIAKSWQIASGAIAAFQAGTSLAAAAQMALTAAQEAGVISQTALNVAMSLNPIGIVVAALAALVAGLIIFSSTIDTVNPEVEALNETNELLSDSLAKVGESALDFYNGIQSAGSVLDDFDESLIVSTEKQAELTQKMKAVQDEITAITENATESRRSLTQKEIDRLNELFDQMEKLAEQQLEIQKAYQKAVQDMAEDAAENHSLSLEEYSQYSQKLINSANKTKDEVIAAADKQYLETLALARKANTENGILNEESYKEARLVAEKRRSDAVESANKEHGDTLAIIKKGYFDRSIATNSHLIQFKKSLDEEEAENKRHNAAVAELWRSFDAVNLKWRDQSVVHTKTFNESMQDLEDRHVSELNTIRSKMVSNLSENEQEQLGTWITMLAQTELYGGKIEDSDREMVSEILKILDELPPEAKEKMSASMDNLLSELRNSEPYLYSQAQSIADGIISRLSGTFEIAVEGKVTGNIKNKNRVYEYAKGTSYHPGGLAIVGENGPELLNLPRGSQVLSNHRLNNLQNQIQGDLSQFSLQLQAAVDSQMHSNTAGIVARSAYSAPRQPVYPMQAPQLTLNYYSSGGTADDAKIIGRRMQREYTNELRSKGVVIL